MTSIPKRTADNEYLVTLATGAGIRRALERTDLTPEDRAQFEQALERLEQQGPTAEAERQAPES